VKYSHKLSDAVHILTYVDIYQKDDLSSRMIAGSIESNPSLVRRLMSLLSKSELLITQSGAVAPRLARPANQISLLDIYEAMDEERNLLHVDPKTNPDCLVGGNIQNVLNIAYQQVQNAAQDSMEGITLQDIIDDILVNQENKTAEDN